jgi:hypothetical protein
VINRLVTSGPVRVAALAVVLASCGYALYLDWPGALATVHRLRWYSVALSLAASMAGAWALMLSWRRVLGDLGSPLPARAAARICLLGQLGKYVPGAVWSAAAQMELGRDHGVPRRRMIASVVISLAITIGTGLALAAAALPLASPGIIRRYWWVLVTIPVIAICLCPPVLGRAGDRALAAIRQPPLESPPTWRGLAGAAGWSVLGMVLLGAQVWFLLASVTGHGPRTVLLAVGGYALGYAAGLLLVVLPSGIGAREVILVTALAATMPHSAALGLALATRLVTTVSDLACGALGFALGRTVVPAPRVALAPDTVGARPPHK